MSGDDGYAGGWATTMATPTIMTAAVVAALVLLVALCAPKKKGPAVDPTIVARADVVVTEELRGARSNTLSMESNPL